jgi:hypothetical protein
LTPHHAKYSKATANGPNSGPDAGAPADEIEITPEMIKAGVAVLRMWDRRIEDDEALCEIIFVEMSRSLHLRASRQQLSVHPL